MILFLLLFVIFLNGSRLTEERRLLQHAPVDFSVSVYSSTLDGLKFTYQVPEPSSGTFSGKVYWVVTDTPDQLSLNEVRNHHNAVNGKCYGSAPKLNTEVWHVTLQCGFIPNNHYYLWVACDKDGAGGHGVVYTPHGILVILGRTSPPSRRTTNCPTITPSYKPTIMPTPHPVTLKPTNRPSRAPWKISAYPSTGPSVSMPTASPTTSTPTHFPTDPPMRTPSFHPSDLPIRTPSQGPTKTPSPIPSLIPSHTPSRCPTASTFSPSIAPSEFIEDVEISFPMDYETTIGGEDRAHLFLKECTVFLLSSCKAVRAGSVILTLEGTPKQVETDIANINAHCLRLEGFPPMCPFGSGDTGTSRSGTSPKNTKLLSTKSPILWMLLATLAICLLCCFPYCLDRHKRKYDRTDSMKSDTRVEQLLEDCRREALKHKDELVTRSTTPEDAVQRMNEFIDRYANVWVERDRFIEEVPKQRIEELKKELKDVFRIACKLSELLTATRQHALRKMDRIVEASLSEEDCIVRMKHEVDEFTADFISKDDFFTIIPTSQIEAAKRELIESFGMNHATASIYI